MRQHRRLPFRDPGKQRGGQRRAEKAPRRGLDPYVITRYNAAMETTVRRIGNSLGVIVPRPLLDQWGVGEGDRLEITASGIRPRQRRNAQELLDELKLSIALEVVRRHSP